MTKSGDNRVALVGDDDEKLVGSLLGALTQRGIRAMRMPIASLKLAPRPPALTILLESVTEDGGGTAAESIGLERGPYAVLMGPGALAQRLEARQRGFHIIPRKDDASEMAEFIESLLSQAQVSSATTPDGLPLGQMVSSMTANLARSPGAQIGEPVRIKPEAQADTRALASRFAKEIGALAEKAQPSKPPSVALDDLDWDDDPETVEKPEGAALAEWRKSAKIRPPNPPRVPVPLPAPKRELRAVSPPPPPKHKPPVRSPAPLPDPPQLFGSSKGRGLPRPARAKKERRPGLRSTLPGGMSIPPELLVDATPAEPIELDDVTMPSSAALPLEDVHAAITKPHEIEPDPHELTTRQIVSPSSVDEDETVDLQVQPAAEPLGLAPPSPAPPSSESPSSESPSPESPFPAPPFPAPPFPAPPSGMLPEAELASAFDEALADVDADVTAPQATLHAEDSAAVLGLDADAGELAGQADAELPSASVPPSPPSPPSGSAPPSPMRAAGSLPPPPSAPDGLVAPLPPEAPVAVATPAAPKRGMGLGIVVGLGALALLGFVALGAVGAVYWFLRPDSVVAIAGSDLGPDPSETHPGELGSLEPEPGAPADVVPAPSEPSAVELSGVEPSEAEPVEPALVEPAPVEPAPVEPAPVEPAVEPAVVEPAVDPTPSEAPTEPTPSEPSVEVAPTDPEVARERSDAIVAEAEAQEGAGQLAEARATFERAVETYDRNPHAHAGLARVELAAGDAAAAATHAERAASLRRRRPEYQILVGDARRAAGDAAGARRAYQRALDIDPTDTDAQQRLAQ